MIYQVAYGTEGDKHYAQTVCDHSDCEDCPDIVSFGNDFTSLESARKTAEVMARALNVPLINWNTNEVMWWNTKAIKKAPTKEYKDCDLARLCEIAFITSALLEQKKIDMKKYNSLDELFQFVYNPILEEWEKGIDNEIFLDKEEEGYITAYAQRRLIELYGIDLSFERNTWFEKLDIDKDYVFDVMFDINTKFVTHNSGNVYYLNHIIATQREKDGEVEILLSVCDSDDWHNSFQDDIEKFDNGDVMKEQIIEFLKEHIDEIKYTDIDRGIEPTNKPMEADSEPLAVPKYKANTLVSMLVGKLVDTLICNNSIPFDTTYDSISSLVDHELTYDGFYDFLYTDMNIGRDLESLVIDYFTPKIIAFVIGTGEYSITLAQVREMKEYDFTLQEVDTIQELKTLIKYNSERLIDTSPLVLTFGNINIQLEVVDNDVDGDLFMEYIICVKTKHDWTSGDHSSPTKFELEQLDNAEEFMFNELIKYAKEHNLYWSKLN